MEALYLCRLKPVLLFRLYQPGWSGEFLGVNGYLDDGRDVPCQRLRDRSPDFLNSIDVVALRTKELGQFIEAGVGDAPTKVGPRLLSLKRRGPSSIALAIVSRGRALARASPPSM